MYLLLFKKSFFSGVVFFATVLTLSFCYAAWNSTMSHVNAWDVNTASAWNVLVDNISDVNTRLSNFSFSSGNIWVWTTPSTAKLEVNGTIKGSAIDIPWTVVSATGWTIPATTATPPALGYTLLSNYTTSNTASLYSNTFTPSRTSSFVYYTINLDVDRNNNTSQEALVLFVNNTPVAMSYHYPRTSWNEPHPMPISWVYENTTWAPLLFNIRISNGWWWTNCIWKACGANQSMASNMTLLEIAK